SGARARWPWPAVRAAPSGPTRVRSVTCAWGASARPARPGRIWWSTRCSGGTEPARAVPRPPARALVGPQGPRVVALEGSEELPDGQRTTVHGRVGDPVERALGVGRRALVRAPARAALRDLVEVRKCRDHVVGRDVGQAEAPDTRGVDDPPAGGESEGHGLGGRVPALTHTRYHSRGPPGVGDEPVGQGGLAHPGVADQGRDAAVDPGVEFVEVVVDTGPQDRDVQRVE